MLEEDTLLFADRISLLATENAFKVGPHINQVEKLVGKVIRLNIGEPDFNIPDWVKEEVKSQLDANNTHYCDPKGLLSLRQAIADQAGETRHIEISAEHVVVFPGCKPSIGFAQQVYCNPGDEVIYPSPGFPIYESFIRFVGAVPVPLHLQESNGFSFDFEELAELITPRTKLIYLNFPSNPTGAVISKENLEKIASVILSRTPPSTKVFSDEIYEHILYDDQKHFSIASLPGMKNRTIIASGFSKSYAWTGGRVGYAIFPTIQEAETFKQLNINYFSCVPPFCQEGARRALAHPQAKNKIQEIVSTFQNRRDSILQELQTVPGMSCTKPSGAFYLFPNIQGVCEHLDIFTAYKKLDDKIKNKTSPSTLFQMFALYKHQVAVLDRRSFGAIGSENQHYIRLSIASDTASLKEGIKRLRHASCDIKGFHEFVKNGQHLY